MGLFNEPENKEIIAYDFWGNPQKRNLKNFRWRISVYGIVKDNDRILVQRNPHLKAYGLPGGAIEIGEMIEDALIREFREETGYEIEPLKLLTVDQDTFTFNNEDAFSILLLYSAKIVGGEPLQEYNDEDSDQILWLTKEELLNSELLRVFHKFKDHF